MKKLILNLTFLIFVLPCQAKILYVDVDTPDNNDGSSWTKAYRYLQDALAKANSDPRIAEIYVAEGTYRPDETTAGPSGTGSRGATFRLINKVALYGGFAGTETTREQRDWQTNKTILSGDLNDDDVGFKNNGENSYHVVTANGTNATALLDGFTITAGNANGDVWPDDGGGGMNNHDGSPTITNCIFRNNVCFADGGGMRTWGKSRPKVTNCAFIDNSSKQEGGGMMNGPASSPTVINCTFRGNSAGEDGGGMYNNETTNARVTNCTFIANTVKLTGGGMYNVNSSRPTLTNCTFSGNTAGVGGGGISNYKAGAILKNCIFWKNRAPEGKEMYLRSTESEFSSIDVDYCDVRDGRNGIHLEAAGNSIRWGAGNIDTDPKFADDQLRLSAGSPCINAGSNSLVPDGVTTDLDANPRILNGVVDMGAYEFENPSATQDTNPD